MLPQSDAMRFATSPSPGCTNVASDHGPPSSGRSAYETETAFPHVVSPKSIAAGSRGARPSRRARSFRVSPSALIGSSGFLNRFTKHARLPTQHRSFSG